MELTIFNRAKQALTEARTIDEVKDIRDKAEALRLYSKQAGESLEMQNDIAEIKLRAERRAGELLTEMNPRNNSLANLKRQNIEGKSPLLDEIGITKYNSRSWQQIASIPEDTFESQIVSTKANGRELTSAGMLRLAKGLKRDKQRQSSIKAGQNTTLSNPAIQLYNADFTTVNIDANSIDLIITDPPYPKEYLHLFDDLGNQAEQWLKPGGSLLVMCGQSYLPEILTLLQSHLTYNWTIAYLTPGGQSAQLWQRKVNTFWKPVLWFVKGEYTGQWLGDVARSDTNDNDKQYHDWGQSVSGMVDIISRIAKPGNVILDPFMGAGTTGIASIINKCSFIGIDIDSEQVDITRGRIAKASS